MLHIVLQWGGLGDQVDQKEIAKCHEKPPGGGGLHSKELTRLMIVKREPSLG